MVTKATVYTATTDMLIKSIEDRMANGNLVAPWKQTWDPMLGMPRNLKSGANYRGANVMFTLMRGFESPFWLTFNQMKALGGRIKRDENDKALPYTPITYWWFPDPSKPQDEGRIPFAKFYKVWNTKQITGIDDKVAVATLLARDGKELVNPITAAQAIVDAWHGPEIVHTGSKACYSPSADTIRMPAMGAFESAEAYYRALFHEMVHASGHRTRLERDGIVNPIRFAREEYSEEELIAEMGAAMLCSYAGISTPKADANSAAYLHSWLKKLKAEPKLLEKSGRAAQKAVDLIRGIKWEKAK